MTSWDSIVKSIADIKKEFDRLYKCLSVSKSRKTKPETFDANLNGFIKQYNDIVEILIEHYNDLSTDHRREASNFHTKTRDTVIKLFSLLRVNIKVPSNIRLIDPQKLDSDSSSDFYSESEDDTMTPDEFLSLSGKLLPKNYSGDPLSLRAFVNTLKLLKSRAGEDHKDLLIEFILTKIDGAALDAIPDAPADVEEIITCLQTDIKPESSKVIASGMLGLRFNRSASHTFVKQAEELCEAMQRALIVEKIPRDKAREMTIEKTIELCRSNTRSDLVKSVIAATPYADPKEVIAKLILESSTETAEKQVLAFRTQGNMNRRGQFNKSRGRRFDQNDRYQNNFRGNAYSNNSYNYRGRGNNNNKGNYQDNRGRGNQSRGNSRYQNNFRSVRSMEASENSTAPQQVQLGAYQNGN